MLASHRVALTRSLILILLPQLWLFLPVVQPEQFQPQATLLQPENDSSKTKQFDDSFQQSLQQQQIKKIPTKRRRLKVLVYSPTLSWSHAQFLGKIADTLAEAGHEVHFLKFVISPGLRDKNETRLVHKVWIVDKESGAKSSRGDDNTNDSIGSNTKRVVNGFKGTFSWLNAFDHIWNDLLTLMADNCRDIVSRKDLFGQLTAEQFDVGIVEVYDLCPLAVLQLAGVRVKLIAEAVPLFQLLARRFGIPTFSSFVKNKFLYAELNGDGRLSFIDRLRNFYEDFYDWAVMDERVLNFNEEMFRDVISSDFPSMAKIVRSVSLVFVNSNPFFGLPRPTSSKIVEIGGIVSAQLGDESEPVLEKSVADICENVTSGDGGGGVVLISFGTIAQTGHMSAQMRRSILGALERFPEFQFIWKMDKAARLASADPQAPLVASAPNNVHLVEWVNQRALLRHPKMRGFLSHCGWNSVQEAAEAGVPLLGVPLMFEQPHNLGIAIRHGMGVHLNVRDLNGPDGEEALVGALKKILFDKTLRENAQRVKQKLALSPFSPKEQLVRWVEFAAEFPLGALGELNLPGEGELNLFAYYSLDVLLFSAGFLLAVLALTFWVAGKILKNALLLLRKCCFCAKNNEKKIKKKSQ